VPHILNLVKSSYFLNKFQPKGLRGVEKIRATLMQEQQIIRIKDILLLYVI